MNGWMDEWRLEHHLQRSLVHSCMARACHFQGQLSLQLQQVVQATFMSMMSASVVLRVALLNAIDCMADIAL